MEEEKTEEKIKNKRKNRQFSTDKEIKERLDLQFDYDEDKKVEEIYDSFFQLYFLFLIILSNKLIYIINKIKFFFVDKY